ncbi:Cytochrome c oxidase assembly protein cox18, mitochondrial [Coemansia spiralis]|nr:Cytochrome c oxidase assembly protein cox18, mitochondrial [Coemansia spiralis]
MLCAASAAAARARGLGLQRLQRTAWRPRAALLQRRSMGTDTAGDAIGSPMLVKAAESVLESLHDSALLPAVGGVFSESLAYGATPWWAAICGATVALHLVVIVPLKIHQQRIMGRTKRLQPVIQAWQHSVVAAGELEAQGKWVDNNVQRTQGLRKMKLMQQNLLFSQGCHPWFQLLLPLTQMPIWLCFSAALRHLTGHSAWLFDADGARFPVAAGMRSEGPLWFTDLALADPIYGLSLIHLAVNLANVVISRRQIKDGSLLAIARQKSWVTRTITVVSYASPWFIACVSSFQPAGLVLYWATTSSLALVETIALQNSLVRRILKIPGPVQAPALPIAPAVPATPAKPADAQHAGRKP